MKARICLIAVLAAAVLLGLGCKTTIIDPATQSRATYQMGKLTVEEPRDLNTVYAATEKAMSDLELKVVQRAKDELQAEVAARDAQDKKVLVRLLSLRKDATKVSIDVSPVEKAQRIYEAIHDNIGM